MIVAKAIIEMMGSPKEHLEKTMRMYLDKIEEKDITVRDEHVSDAEEKDDMFSMFADLEIEAKDAGALMYFCFDYMPTSVEIIEPDQIVFDSRDFTSFINDLQTKLHQTDMIVKNISAENQLIKKNGIILLRNIIMLQLRRSPNDLEGLAKISGVPEDNLKKVLDQMVKDGKIKKDGELYKVA